MNFSKLLRVRPDHKIKLHKIDPSFTGDVKNNEDTKSKALVHTQKLRDLQYHLYAENKQSLLICLQALDAAGKDGTINHVLGAMNPQGTVVHGFKAPSKDEAAHDFLWRAHLHAPAKGQVGIFNRSHYEDVLVVRVHELVPKSVWSERFDLINDFEQNLVANGTRVLKFFLHISEDEQLRRFGQRLEDPNRHWKISEGDYTERLLWPQYIEAYEEAISKTSTKYAPWYIIPSNHKWFRNLAVAKIVLETMQDMKMKIPAPTVDIAAIKRKYHSAKRGERRLEHELKDLE